MRIPRGVLAPVAFVAVLLLVPTGSSIAQVNVNDIVGGTISATASPGDPILVTNISTVPAGRRLVLTDFEYAVVLHPDQFGSSIETPVVLLQGVTEKWGSVWFGYSSGSAARNLLSRSFTTGIVFAPGSPVNVRHHPGADLTGIATAEWRISWSGYLTAATTALGELNSGSVEGLALLPATPNPLTSQTQIHFAIPANGHVTLRIFDVTGRVVRILTDSVLGAGEHALAWDARDEAGQAVPSGVYFVDLAMGATRTARKAIVLE